MTPRQLKLDFWVGFLNQWVIFTLGLSPKGRTGCLLGLIIPEGNEEGSMTLQLES